jgi:hypothetical protein
MNRFLLVLVLACLSAAAGNSQSVGKPPPIFVVHGPIVVAFFPPVTRADLDSDPDANEALSDFQFFAGSVKAPLRKAGIDFQEADALSFKIRIGMKTRTFKTGKDGVGYYFIAPGKSPHVEYGVMTDVDLLAAARKYLGIPIQ